MTADALQGESDKCFEIGMNDYISKPFEPGDLYNKILHLTQKV
jgi:CheY-like chemotaxis protein